MTPQEYQMFMVFFFIGLIMTFLFVVLLIVMLWFRTAIFNEIKLKKMIKKGYIIARLKRFDKTEKEIVTIPEKETNGVRFPNIEGLYTMDDASVTLKNRKYPIYEWREGETAPINHQLDYVPTNIKCPSCNVDFIANMAKPKSIAPSVLDNLILKIKTLATMVGMNRYLLFILIVMAVVVVLGLGNLFILNDFKSKAADIISPQVVAGCKQAFLQAKSNITI